MKKNSVENNKETQFQGEYTNRINRVIDYIDKNLGEELSLATLSKVACFSPFHFHRIFSVMVNEPLGGYVQRRRVEKAAGLLIANPNRTVTEIAMECGFLSSANFARVFKKTFQMSAIQWRKEGYLQFEKKGKSASEDSKKIWAANVECAADNQIEFLSMDSKNRPSWNVRLLSGETTKVQVITLPGETVVYVRHIGPYQGMSSVFEEAFNRLMKWAVPRGLVSTATKPLVIYYDDPQITADAKLRFDACIAAPSDVEVQGEIGKNILPGGQYAVGRFELGEKEYATAWSLMMGVWLPQSGFEPADGPCFERYHNDCTTHPEGKSVVDICVPVRPLVY